MKRLTREAVDREIAGLEGLDITTLQNRWQELYKLPPPFKIRSGFLRRAIAYRLQELLHGGLRLQTKRELRRVAESVLPRRKILSAGTRRLREWNGTTEVVDVLADGFGWRGKTYRTLSAVAVAITGTKWSGPKFFGLVTTNIRSRSRIERSCQSPLMRLAPMSLRHERTEDVSLCRLHKKILRGGARAGFQLARGAARGMRGLYPVAVARGLEADP